MLIQIEIYVFNKTHTRMYNGYPAAPYKFYFTRDAVHVHPDNIMEISSYLKPSTIDVVYNDPACPAKEESKYYLKTRDGTVYKLRSYHEGEHVLCGINNSIKRYYELIRKG